MSLIKTIGSLFGGDGLGGKIIDGIKEYFPPKATPEEAARLEMAIRQNAHQIELQVADQQLEQQKEFNDRISELEGTAKDLQQFGWIGKIVIFLRGVQRPMWGYMVAYMDIMVYSGKWTIEKGTQLESSFWIINFLVLGFLFGERAIKNIIPLVATYLKSSKKE